jgi:type VI secretion system secreted protein VgrG
MATISAVSFTGPSTLAADTLTFVSMVGTEALGHCFEYTVDVLSSEASLAAADVVKQNVTVHQDLNNDSVRHFNGLVSAFEYRGTDRDGARYRLIVRPWLWFLSRGSGCRIFQNLSVVGILNKIFDEYGFSGNADVSNLQKTYAPREFVVQYRETDLNFVSRLMESEGIYYFFRHADGAHTLVLVDSPVTHTTTPGYETIPFRVMDVHREALMEYVSEWNVALETQPGRYSQADFDFTKPNTRLYSTTSNPQDCDLDQYEVYEYPGGFATNAVGDAYSVVRLEELQVRYNDAFGETNARGVSVGSLFSLVDHPRDDLDVQYLVTSTRIHVRGPAVSSTSTAAAEESFSCSVAAIDPNAPYRPAATAMKPVVRGPQTAIVVGPRGEEIWTDQYGRVKIQFHWDRIGKSDANSSCWVRVSQIWAGTNWGGIHIPRIGQEVIVEFLEGDPDRPIVTGRVYNNASMPPYDLPAHQTQSGIKSRSTKGGSLANSNELRFEDSKGSEELYVQAEKDLNALVKNNEAVKVGVNRTVSIGSDDSLTVGNNRTVQVDANESITVSGNETVSIGGNQSVSVTGNDTTSVTGNESTSITGSQTLAVTGSRSAQVLSSETILVVAAQAVTAGSQAITVGSRTTTVAGGDTLNVGGDLGETIGGARSESMGADHAVTVGGNQTLTISGNQTVSITGGGTIQIGKDFVIDVGQSVVIQAGDASITLEKSGDITVKGGKVTVQASSDLVLKGSKISLN